MVLAWSGYEGCKVAVRLWEKVVRGGRVCCHKWCGFSKGQPPVDASEGVFGADEGLVLSVVVAVHRFRLPWESFDSVGVVSDSGRCYVLQVVKATAAAELVSEYRCRVSCGRGVCLVNGCSF